VLLSGERGGQAGSAQRTVLSLNAMGCVCVCMGVVVVVLSACSLSVVARRGDGGDGRGVALFAHNLQCCPEEEGWETF
jgi:hypothetical protein